MIRRYIYRPDLDRVVEVGPVTIGVAEVQKMDTRKTREGALERAGRREFAHRKYGDERRWKET